MGAFFGILGLLVCIAALVFLIWPAPLRRVGGRLGAAITFGVGFCSFFLGVAITPASTAATAGDHPALVRNSASVGGSQGADALPPGRTLGTPIDHEGWEVTVTGVDTADTVGPSFMRERAADGGVLVVVSYAVKNISDHPISAFALPTLHLIDPTGVKYNDDAGKDAALEAEGPGDMKMLSDLNPGLTVRDRIVFEVSSASFNDRWTIDAGDGGDPVRLAAK